MTKSTTFQANVAVSGGSLDGSYLWSNPDNWTNGVPADGDSVSMDVSGLDDMAGLTSLAALDLGSNATLYTVVTNIFDITTLAANPGAVFIMSQPVEVVTVATLTGSGAGFAADAAGDRFIDQSASDAGNLYLAEGGGTIELSPAPANASTLEFGPSSTITLGHPGATNAVNLLFLAQSDVLELPGTTVTSFMVGAHSLTITTDDGSYAFTNVDYDASITGYAATYDSVTGLEAITFHGPTSFQDNEANGEIYLWSDANNWSNFQPIDGDSVSTDASGEDDLPPLTLSGLSLTGSANIFLPGTLTIGTLAGAAGTTLSAGGGTAPLITVSTITGTGGTYIADGAQASFVDNGSVDDGETYDAESGGLIVLAAPPSSASVLDYIDSASTIALRNPAADNSVTLDDVVPGDVLELPDSAVLGVSFGADSLSVDTSVGNYVFTDVTYDLPVAGYSAAYDSATGLEALTFQGADTFEANAAVSGGQLNGEYLWSNAANWSDGVPADGSAVGESVTGYDDIDDLTLSSLALNVYGTELYVFTNSLTIDSLHLSSGELIANSFYTGFPVQVVINSVDGFGYLDAYGPQTVMTDLQVADPGDYYVIDDGGIIVMAAPPSNLSSFNFGNDTGVLVLEHPAAITGAILNTFLPGDALEVPGTAVLSVTLDPGNIAIVTNAGSYDFDNVQNEGSIAGYSAGHDTATGLEKITFQQSGTTSGQSNVFTDTTAATAGVLSGQYLWSNLANWSIAVPIEGGDATIDASGYDDTSVQTLGTLTLAHDAQVNVVGNSPSFDTVIGASDAGITAGSPIPDSSGGPVTVTIGTLTGAGGEYGAAGTYDTFINLSATDAGESYLANDGGVVELSAAPAAASALEYLGAAPGTIALFDPQASNAVAVDDVSDGDVLEVPGNSVSNVTYGANSLSITTDAGTYAFSDVTYLFTPGIYSAAHDSATGLEAITFLPQFLPPVNFSEDGRIDSYVVPATGTYDITASGATGGGFGAGYAGGAGAQASGIFTLSAGDTIEVLVGAVGTVEGSAGGGGGGGSFVYDLTTATLLVAAGGGGASAGSGGSGSAGGPGGPGLAGTSGGDGGNYVNGYGISHGGAGGTDGSGGAAGSFAGGSPGNNTDSAGGGGGFSSNGDDGTEGLGGHSFLAGGAGGLTGTHGSVAGGFGGGGGANSSQIGGGGGGGYSGGGAGEFDTGGGGGSYVAPAATNPATESGANSGGNGAVAISQLACYAAGTHILTDQGEMPVEALAIGDHLPALLGSRLAPVRWIGHRRVDCRLHPDPASVWPIRVKAGAFAAAMPARDLLLSPDHAIYVDDVLIPVRYLVNGASIARQQVEQITYYHVELPAHDVILAEGLPAESYLDTGNRAAFANADAPAMTADFARRVWQTQSCAPLVVEGPPLHAVRQKLLLRAETLGHGLTRDAAPSLIAGGQAWRAEGSGGRYRFTLPSGTCSARLASRAAIPAEILADGQDHRRLGIAVARLALDGHPLALSDPRLTDGWHDPETDAAWRWTDGDAGLRLDGARSVEIDVALTACYWTACYRRNDGAMTRVA